MNEYQFGNRIRQLLNQAARVDARTAERLRAARERALEHQKIERAHGLAWADNVLGNLGGLSGVSVRFVLPLVVLVVGLVSINLWQQKQRTAEYVEIDTQLLSDDLPIDAYLDKDFEAWLRRQGSS
jgi:hypothetical protein